MPDNLNVQALYAEHLTHLQTATASLLEQLNYEGLLIGSGSLVRRFMDDNTYPFFANPYFVYWLPFLNQHPDCWLLIRAGETPRLYFPMPDDFWHKTPELPDQWWSAGFDIVPVQGCADLPKGRLAVIAPALPEGGDSGWELNPESLVLALHQLRSIKTEWESECLRQANYLAVQGHCEAVAAFREGCSEYEIHQRYLSAIEHNESQMPYANIVGLNEHGAILHYQFQARTIPDQHRSLLIDAGAVWHGYAADITRTQAQSGTLFAELVARLDAAQQAIVAQVRDSVDFVALHEQMHRSLASILRDTGIVRNDPDAQLELGITQAFYPHGLGHLLGIQVHDVGGWQHDPSQRKPPAEHPYLRFAGTLKQGMVVTIEPGLYFIESLLKPLRNEPKADIDWARVEALSAFGGIRIEDNIRVTGIGCENYTRDGFAKIINHSGNHEM